MKRIFTFYLFIFALYSFGQIPSTGLIERFMFNNNLNGQMGNVFSSLKPSYDFDRFGNPNSAYKIIVDSSCIVNGFVNNIPQGNSDRSVCLWIKNIGNPNAIRSYFNYSIEYNCFAFADETAPNYKVVTNYGSYVTSNNPPDNLWHCLVATHSVGTTSFYIDGTFIGSNAITYANNTSLVRMGHSPASVGTGIPYFGFSVDELLIYNRALTPSEVNQICSFGNSVSEVYDLSNSTTLFPTPASKSINISSSADFDYYEITDLAGKSIIRKNLTENKISFDLNSGVYFLKLFGKENVVATKKIVIQ